jgi:hypothetical protein
MALIYCWVVRGEYDNGKVKKYPAGENRDRVF